MKNFFVISLMAILLLQTFSKVVVLVDFQANKEYIMEFLCINRDKPNSECEGKCQLTKKLKAQHDTDKQTSERGLKQEVQVYLYNQNLFLVPDFSVSATHNGLTRYSTSYTSVNYHRIFHPPQVIV